MNTRRCEDAVVRTNSRLDAVGDPGATSVYGAPGNKGAYVASNNYGRSLITYQRDYAPSTSPGSRILGVLVDRGIAEAVTRVTSSRARSSRTT